MFTNMLQLSQEIRVRISKGINQRTIPGCRDNKRLMRRNSLLSVRMQGRKGNSILQIKGHISHQHKPVQETLPPSDSLQTKPQQRIVHYSPTHLNRTSNRKLKIRATTAPIAVNTSTYARKVLRSTIPNSQPRNVNIKSNQRPSINLPISCPNEDAKM